MCHGHAAAIMILVLLFPLQPVQTLADPACEVTELAQFDGGDSVAISVAIDDDTFVVGRASVSGGRATAYRRKTGLWDTGTVLTASDASTARYFGHSVGIDGDLIVVGSPWATGAEHDSGAAYIFRHHCGEWTQEVKLIAEEGHESDAFGYGTAISGDTIVIGAIHETGVANQSGAAHIYRLVGSTWIHEVRLSPDDLRAGAIFGISVAISGDVVIVGARHDNAAYIFRRTDGTWTQEAKFTANDGFGGSVAVSGDACLVGTTFGHVARVYRYIEGTWTLEASLQGSNAHEWDRVGYSVSLDQDIAVVGVVHWDGPWGVFISRPTLVFEYKEGAWSEAIWLMPTDVVFRPYGIGVAVNNGTAVVLADANIERMYGTTAYTYRGIGDCNGNDVLDACDIVAGTSLDANANGIPDECTTEEAFVNSSDLPEDCETADEENQNDNPDGSEVEDNNEAPKDPPGNALPLWMNCGDGACGSGLLTCCLLTMALLRLAQRRRGAC